MREVGSYEAKTHLPALLRAVEAGETIVITRNGEPIADLTPHRGGKPKLSREELEALKERMWEERSKRPPVTTQEILSAIREGRE